MMVRWLFLNSFEGNIESSNLTVLIKRKGKVKFKNKFLRKSTSRRAIRG